MGLFGSSTRTSVATSVVRVIENNAVPNAINTGSIKALFNDGNIADYVMEELVDSVGVKAERMYQYAAQNYTHGLPSGRVYSSTQGRQQVEATIEALEGQQVLMEYSHFGPPNAIHIGWMKLVSQYGYTHTTNRLIALEGSIGAQVFLEDMVVVLPAGSADTYEKQALEVWGVSPSGGYTPERLASTEGVISLAKASRIQVSSSVTEAVLKVTYCWRAGNSISAPTQRQTMTLTINEYNGEADFFHAKYTVAGQTKYWIYENDSGGYPLLDAVYTDGPAVSGTYFPFAYFRYNKSSMLGNTATPAYQTTERMLKYLGVDYETVAQSIDENPDIADVEQAILMFGIPAVSTNDAENRYLFDYFNNMYYVMGEDTQGHAITGILSLFGTSTPKNTSTIGDSKFRMSFGNNGIYKRLTAGTIGPVGAYTSSYSRVPTTSTYQDAETGQEISVAGFARQHKYCNQVSPGMYEEILVIDLQMKYYIWEGYATTGDETDDILLVPIDRSIATEYSIPVREELYSRSLHFVFNSRVTQKLKWYQTGIFKAFMIVVAVVITIYNPPAGLAALELTGAALVLAAVIYVAIVGAITQKIFKLFVKTFGADVAQAIAILAIIYGGYKVFQNGGNLSGTWASELLSLSNGLQSAVIQDKFSDLLEQKDQFNLFVEEQNKLLDDAQKLLETSKLLNPFVIFGEKPEDFYNRTVHFSNIGTLGITAISSYVDMALTLPKINDTLGEIQNG
ncbi:MAG: hypothetical protein E6R03_11555 [Hyphomicrobiaceae bacterium]|nr:MAG: hypothetical protein E6R03_11555 [Hyphomicrobiaceae bacterium]